ncbi:MAG: hypothetical protein KDB18_09615, partial [Salinibacterium sp.]|nr:hypothetical protein [Salinibacterium sp.]
MGEQKVQSQSDAEQLRAFVRHVLRDLRAMEQMLLADAFEVDPIRIGAEQEFFLVDEGWRPLSVSEKVLADCKHMSVTPELARFNIELNAPPYSLGGTCLSELEDFLTDGTAKLRLASAKHGAKLVMCGILPTLTPADLDLSNMVDSPR